mgnify:CR=1 FL=1
MQKNKKFLYSYLANALLEYCFNETLFGCHELINIVIDKKDTNKSISTEFKNYLKNNFSQKISGEMRFEIKPSYTNKCLQAVDFASWAIFRKYEQNDLEYLTTLD